MLFLVMVLFTSFPFLTIAIGLKSLPLLLFGVGFGMIACSFFLWNAFSDFRLEHRATPVDEALNERFQKLWNEAGPERVVARFWIYPATDTQFRVWVRNARSVDVFFTLGLLQLATDAGLRAAFQSISGSGFSDIKLQNRRHALTRQFERWKGPMTDFRYWFVSFWLYPLERLLKIDKI